MSKIMKPPEYSAPPVPGYAQVNSSRPLPGKYNRWVWIALGILALVSFVGSALIAFGLAFAIHTVGGPTMAVDQYYSAIKDQDYARAYTFLGSDLKATLSQEAFTQAAELRDAAAGKVSRFAFSTASTGDPTMVSVTVTRTAGISYTVHLQVRHEGDTWKIAAFDHV
jgi:hypothetical protein